MLLLRFVNESSPSGTRHASDSVVHSDGGGGGGDASNNESVMRAMAVIAPLVIVEPRYRQWNGGARAAAVAVVAAG